MASIKLKTKEAINIHLHLKKLSEVVEDMNIKKDIEFSVLFNIYLASKKTKDIFNSFRETENNLINTLGTEICTEGKDKDGKSIYTPTGQYHLGDKRKEFDEQKKELNNVEVEIELPMFKLSQLKSIITPNSIEALEPILEFDI